MRALADAGRVRELMRALGLGLIERKAMLRYYERVSADLHRYPAIDPQALRKAVERLFGLGPAHDDA